MNLELLNRELLKATRAELAAALVNLDKVLANANADDVTKQIRELYPQEPALEARSMPALPYAGKTRARVQSHVRAMLESWVTLRAEKFQLADLPPELRPNGDKATMMLCNMVTKGRLRRVGRGTYQRPGPEPVEPAPPPVVPLRPEVKTPPVAPVKPVAPVESSNAQESPFGAVAIAIGRGFAGSFTMLDLSARLDGRQPQAAQFLGAWRARGWIIQSGYGQFKLTPKFGT